MRRMAARFTVLFLLGVLATGVGTLAGVGFSGSIGLETTFAPIPLSSYGIASQLSLGLRVPGFSFDSTTVFDLAGFQSQEFAVAAVVGPVSLANDILFDPSFTRDTLSLDTQIIGIETGLDFILANTGSAQTPSYNLGAVVKFSSTVMAGFSLTTLTGFGATNLVNLLGGVEAPFSHDLLYTFGHIASLFNPVQSLVVTIVPGFYFEEELVRLEIDYSGVLASSTTWFDWTGFSKQVLEFGYQYGAPRIAFLTSLSIDGTFTITALSFILDADISGVRVTSRTRFAAPNPPLPIPVVFSGEGIAVSFDLLGARITTETDFDDSFLFEQEFVALELTVDPVTFSSLSLFDTGGFAHQWVAASISFSGVTLYTRAAFGVLGVSQVVFGFEFEF